MLIYQEALLGSTILEFLAHPPVSLSSLVALAVCRLPGGFKNSSAWISVALSLGWSYQIRSAIRSAYSDLSSLPLDCNQDVFD
jgi:hypothetical protein